MTFDHVRLRCIFFPLTAESFHVEVIKALKRRIAEFEREPAEKG